MLTIAGSRIRVRVASSEPYSATLVPDEAILADQEKRFVLVLGPDNIVLRRDIQPGRLLDDGMRLVRGANDAPAMTVTPPGPYTDQQLVRVQLRNLEPRRFGILALCLDPVRAAAIVDTGSGDGISAGCMELASLGSTPIGEWPPAAEFIEVSLPRRLVDANGDSHDCMEVPGCRLSVGWGTTTYLSSGLRSIEISFAE